MAGLWIDVSDGTPPVLRVRGELDLASADELAAALSSDRTMRVDMGGVTFIDASGLRAILQVAESMNGSGPVCLLNAGRVARLLKLVGLDDISSIDFATEEEGHVG